MIYILPGNVVARVLHLSAGLVTTTPVSPLFGLGVVVIVFLAVVTGHKCLRLSRAIQVLYRS